MIKVNTRRKDTALCPNGQRNVMFFAKKVLFIHTSESASLATTGCGASLAAGTALPARPLLRLSHTALLPSKPMSVA